MLLGTGFFERLSMFLKHCMVWILGLVGCWPLAAAAQGLVPNGMQQFVDGNGAPYASGLVYTYVPYTTSPKTTWKDPGLAVPNTNPIVLDSSGRAIIYGSGQYRQILQNSSGVTIWDQLTYGISSVFYGNIGANQLLGNPTGSAAQPQALGVAGGLSFSGGNLLLDFVTATDSSNQTVTAGFQLTQRIATVGLTYTLPLASTLFNGFGFWGTTSAIGPVVISPNVADTINGASVGASVTIPPGYTFYLFTNGVGKWYLSVSLNYGSSGSGASVPQGRLTLVSGTPVMTTTVSGASTVYYTLYVGNQIPLINSSTISQGTFGELSQPLADSTRSPSAAGANSNYDLFVWVSGGTPVLSRGPAWASDTTRGTGAGTSQLIRLGGFLVNAQAVTNGPAAQQGLYVGSVRTNGSSLVDYAIGGAAAGGTPGSFGVWNTYNRVSVGALVSDSTGSWSYGTAIWRPSDNSANMRVSWLSGLQEEPVSAVWQGYSTPTGGYAANGIGLDSVSSPATGSVQGLNGTSGISGTQASLQTNLLGWHYVQALEIGNGGTTSWTGTSTPGAVNGLTVNFRN
jgi:hypothetical protein